MTWLKVANQEALITCVTAPTLSVMTSQTHSARELYLGQLHGVSILSKIPLDTPHPASQRANQARAIVEEDGSHNLPHDSLRHNGDKSYPTNLSFKDLSSTSPPTDTASKAAGIPAFQIIRCDSDRSINPSNGESKWYTFSPQGVLVEAPGPNAARAGLSSFTPHFGLGPRDLDFLYRQNKDIGPSPNKCGSSQFPSTPDKDSTLVMRRSRTKGISIGPYEGPSHKERSPRAPPPQVWEPRKDLQKGPHKANYFVEFPLEEEGMEPLSPLSGSRGSQD